MRSRSCRSFLPCAPIALPLLVAPSVAYAHDPEGLRNAIVFVAWVLIAVVALAVVPLKRIALRSERPADRPAWGNLFAISVAETLLSGMVFGLWLALHTHVALVVGAVGYLVAIACFHRRILRDQVKGLRTALAMTLPVPVVFVVLFVVFMLSA